MSYTALPEALASATDNDYSSDDCPTYLLTCMSSPALDIPDLSSTRSRDLTRHEMNHPSVLLVSALVFDDEPSPLHGLPLLGR